MEDSEGPQLVGRSAFGLHDERWTEQDWFDLLTDLVAGEFFSWKDVTTVILGQVNPPQVGTQIASNKAFQANLGGGEASVMSQVYRWLYDQTGRCVDCGTMLDLQADHIDPRQSASLEDPTEVDRLDNLILRCRRHNVIRRVSHKLGGKTHLSAESGLMWILLVLRPRGYQDFLRMCRLYGMTMADVRQQEAWAMAVWLARSGQYEITDAVQRRIVLELWDDGAITRRKLDDPRRGDPTELGEFSNEDRLTFLSEDSDGVLTLSSIPLDRVPFSTYDLDGRPPQALCIMAQQPKADENGDLIALPLMPPRGRRLIEWTVHPADVSVAAEVVGGRGRPKLIERAKVQMSRKVPVNPGQTVSLVTTEVPDDSVDLRHAMQLGLD